MTAQLLDQMTRLLHLGLRLRNRSLEMQHEHRVLVKALARSDGETAERISREQIEAARKMLVSAIMTNSTVLTLTVTADHGGPQRCGAPAAPMAAFAGLFNMASNAARTYCRIAGTIIPTELESS